jgi:tRNA nucleotidyltransferase (CCA-adding enzyme)
MKTYAVGGSVRDSIMKNRSNDYDWVVVGATEQEMLDRGFTKVGADFPVFLHPTSGSEYALARREKKTGTGYLGFESEFGIDVTLEEDLGRRDLTINSIAIGPIEEPENMETIDPYGGEEDIKNKILRHTSNAFEEDPVRVLRIARFRARFGSDWTVAQETKDLIYMMAKKGVLDELQPDRIWKEMSRALMEPYPRLFFDTLLECDALHVIFPEIYRLKTALESRKWHPEGDAFSHVQLVLTQSAKMGYDLETRVMCLVHDFGKGITPIEKLPKHHGHDVNGVPIVSNFLKRIKAPTKFVKHAEKITRYHMVGHRLHQMKPNTFVKMFDDMGILNDPESVDLLYKTFQCDTRGRLGSENDSIEQLDIFLDFVEAYRSVKFVDVFPNGETNANKIKQGMFNARVKAVKAVK